MLHNLKRKIKEHRVEIATTGFIVALVALAVVVDVKVAQQEAEARQELDEFIVKSNREGKTVYQLANGQHIAVRVEE